MRHTVGSRLHSRRASRQSRPVNGVLVDKVLDLVHDLMHGLCDLADDARVGGRGGFLVDSVSDGREGLLDLLKDPLCGGFDLARRAGSSGGGAGRGRACSVGRDGFLACGRGVGRDTGVDRSGERTGRGERGVLFISMST